MPFSRNTQFSILSSTNESPLLSETKISTKITFTSSIVILTSPVIVSTLSNTTYLIFMMLLKEDDLQTLLTKSIIGGTTLMAHPLKLQN